MTINKILFTLFITITSFGFSQNNTQINYKSGCMHGEYQSFHENGQLKAEGNFFYNRRIGEWNVYNPEGEIIAQRHFDSLGHVKVNVPTSSNDAVIELLDKPRYKIERNKVGKYEWSQVKEGNVVWSKRVWSYFPEETNPDIYAFDWLQLTQKFELDEDDSLRREVTVYKNDEFKSFYEGDKSIAISHLKFLGVGLKKDYYYDLASRKMDARVIGITVFTENTITGQSKNFTYYYPTDLRPLLLQVNINHEDPNISNLDDLIFFNAYAEIIYREESVNPPAKKFEPKEIDTYKAFSNEVKTQVIEVAHGFWVGI